MNLATATLMMTRETSESYTEDQIKDKLIKMATEEIMSRMRLEFTRESRDPYDIMNITLKVHLEPNLQIYA